MAGQDPARCLTLVVEASLLGWRSEALGAQLVDYRDVQFTKAPWILSAMGLDDLEKRERAVDELRSKGLAPPPE